MTELFSDKQDKLFLSRLSVYKKPQKTATQVESGKEEPEKKDDEKPDEGAEVIKRKPGVPIDVEAEELAKKKAKEAARKKAEAARLKAEKEKKEREKRAKEQAEKLRQQKLTIQEKVMMKKFGCQVLDMGKIEGKKYKGNVLIDAPKKIVLDENGKPKKPRLVFHFNGNGGTSQIGKGTENILNYAEEMRKKGDPVVIVWMTDGKGAWRGMQENPEQFEDIMRVAETATGQPVAHDITISSYSAGYRGVGPMLRYYREQSAHDPKAKEVYDRIRRISALDTLYAEWDAFAQWAKKDGNVLNGVFTEKSVDAHRFFVDRLKELGVPTDRYNIARYLEEDGRFGSHGESVKKFASFSSADLPTKAEYEGWEPEAPKEKLTGSKFIEALGKCKTAEERQRLILENLPDEPPEYEPIKITAPDGTTVEIRVSKREIKVGPPGDQVGVAMDGPTAIRAAARYNASIPDYWLAKQIHEQAKKNGQTLPFVAAPAIAKKLKIAWDNNNPNGEKMMSAEFLGENNNLNAYWAKKKGVEDNDFAAGYFKTVVHPIPGVTGDGRLEIYQEMVQKKGGPSGGAHGELYRDYSHRVRTVDSMVLVDGVEMSLAKFMASEKYAKKFGFQATDINGSYNLPEQMKLGKSGRRADIRVSETPTSAGEQPKEDEPREEHTPPTDYEAWRSDRPTESSGGAPRSSSGSAPSVHYEGPPPSSPRSSEKPSKQREKVPRIAGPTLFLGDSITVGVRNKSAFAGIEKRGTISESGETSIWLLKEVKWYAKNDPDYLKSFDNAFMLIGTNDIGFQSADSIINRIEKIWKILTDHGIKIYAATIPPHKGYKGYDKKFKTVNNRRLAVNKFIKESKVPHEVVDLAAPITQGGLADPDDLNRFARKDSKGRRVSWDALHPDKDILAEIYAGHLRGKGAKEPEYAPTGGKRLAEFEPTPEFNERTTTYKYPEGKKGALKVHINAPGNFDPKKPTRIVLYALPNVNSIEWTVGKKRKKGEDRHFEWQNIGAQTRVIRQGSPDENIVVAYIETPRKSFPSWRKNNPDAGAIIDGLIGDVRARLSAPEATADLTGHSGGGSMESAYMNSRAEIPDDIRRISYMDSNYGYTSAQGKKIASWLKRSPDHYFSVISYDGRNTFITSKGKRQNLGSTYRKTHRMLDDLRSNGIAVTEKEGRGHTRYTALNGRVNLVILHNPGNSILHTETVGRNGFIFTQTAGTEQEELAQFNGRIAYNNYVQSDKAKVA
ncbi:SGNH/GDSL hydrolase family protein [Pseudomonadota bacterium]